MPADPPDYEAIEIEMWRKNADSVAVQLQKQDGDLLKRVQTYVGRFGFQLERVERKIRDDSMFAAHFAKEPRRQGFHELVARE